MRLTCIILYIGYIHVNDAAAPTVRLPGWSSETASLPSAVGIQVDGWEMLTVLERGTSLPAANSCQVTTSTDYQTVGLIQVFYGDCRRTARNTLLGSARLTGIPARRKGEVTLRLTFGVDVKGVVTLEATDVTSKRMWKDIVLHPIHRSIREQTLTFLSSFLLFNLTFLPVMVRSNVQLDSLTDACNCCVSSSDQLWITITEAGSDD